MAVLVVERTDVLVWNDTAERSRTEVGALVALSPVRVDAAVDLAYGALIILSIILIATLEFGIGIAFGVGVFSAYVLHVVWKMARFDPEWMTQAVEETVEEAVEESVGETVGKQVEETVEGSVGETVEEAVERQVEETVGETVERTVGETVGKQVEEVQAQVKAVDERIDRRPRAEEVEEIVEESVEDDASE
ncbi:glutamate-rich protein [Natronococcus amylolyticus DSM 10524]|uniref:Glutamate-rich protein n=1 Tax=Natronococcus amylolyticus DSM 10524 TaxID=1227497 RepID=L9XCZ8_9EURY|nr:glutamate-rich protein [Natronococcus amylolyticus DSM 10524]